jgi:hypothetical protein
METDHDYVTDSEAAAVMLRDLGPDERAVLMAIADRLRHGAKLYGPLRVASDRRDWRQEAAEELFDGCVYLALAASKDRR